MNQKKFFLLIIIVFHSSFNMQKPKQNIKPEELANIKIKIGLWENKTNQKLYFSKDSISDSFDGIGKIKPGQPFVANKLQQFTLTPRDENMFTFDLAIRNKVQPYPRLALMLIYQPKLSIFTGKLILKKSDQSEKEISKQQLNIPKDKLNEISAIQVNGMLEGNSLELSQIKLEPLEKQKAAPKKKRWPW